MPMARAGFPDHILGPDEIPTVAWQNTTLQMQPVVVRDWSPMVGVLVKVRRDGQVIRTGLVDDITPSGDIIWIAADGFDSRIMIDKREGYTLAIVQELR
jgi:hypothetical protein